MSRDGRVAKQVLKRIEGAGPGSDWTYADFKDLPFVAVAKALSRLTKDKKIVRVRKGVYHFPRKTALGETGSSSSYVIGASFPSTYYGATMAAYNLGLTTQVPANPVIFGDVSYRKDNILGTDVTFRKRDVSHLKKLDDLEINLIEALRNIKKIPGMGPAKAVEALKDDFKRSSKTRDLLRAVKHEPPRVRAMVGAIYQELGLHLDDLKSLKKTLNPLTHYHLGVSNALKYADDWNIK